MGNKSQQPLLRLVDDPVVRTMQMLRQLPLEMAVGYLEKISNRADRLGLLSDADRQRIGQLIHSIPLPRIDKAA